MVLEVSSDAGERVHHRDAVALELVGRADAGEEEELRRVVGAAAEDHLALGLGSLHGPGRLAVLDAASPAYRRRGLVSTCEPGSAVRLRRPRAGSEVPDGGAASHAATLGDLVDMPTPSCVSPLKSGLAGIPAWIAASRAARDEMPLAPDRRRHTRNRRGVGPTESIERREPAP